MRAAKVYRSPRLVGSAVLMAWLGVACSSPPPDAMAPPAVPVRTQALRPGLLEESSEFIGALEAEQRVELRAEMAGRITQVAVAAGSGVSPGQAMVQLRPNQAQAEVAGAQAGAQAAQFGRDAAQAQVEVAQADISRARSEVQLAEVEFGRAQRLNADGALSRQDLDNARNRLEVAQASQRAATESLRAAQSELQRATATFEQAQAQVNVNQDSLSLTQVVAPVAGLVGDVPVQVGDFVNAGQTLTTIIQNQELALRVQVPSSRSDQLRLGLPVELLSPETGASVATGSLSFISPDVDGAVQSILVKARFPNETGNLRDGQFVRARLIWDTTSALLIPTVAVSRVAGQSFVFVVANETTEDGQTLRVASQRPVQLGSIQDGQYQVISGLEPGDEVIVSNILQLQDGVPVEPEAQTSAVGR